MQLRDYQERAIHDIRALYASGKKKVLLQLPTGAGKTEIFCYIAREMVRRRKLCFVVTRGRELVYNAYERLLARGVDAGIIMAGNAFVSGKFCYVLSIDTVIRRSFVPDNTPELCILDEGHFAAAPSFKKLSEQFPHAYYLPVTATPWQQGSIRHVANDWVSPITYDGLVAKGFLVPSKVYAPIDLDLSEVRTKAGDYREDDLMKAVDKTHVYGNIIKYYAEITVKAPALCFCVNVEHSKNMEAIFNAHGIRARHLDAGSSDSDRKQATRLLGEGSLDVITNCNILSTGIDLPQLRCIVSARPTASRILWVQQAGRGSRPSPDKSFFYLMDHANNTRTHGFIEEHQDPLLDGKPKAKKSTGVPAVKTCKNCYAIVLSATRKCEQCGYDFEAAARALRIKEDAELLELTRGAYEDATLDIDEDYLDLAREVIEKAYVRGYKRSYIYVALNTHLETYLAAQLSAREVVDFIVAQIEQDRTCKGLEKSRGFGSRYSGQYD